MHSKAAIAHLAAAFPKAFFIDAARRRPLKSVSPTTSRRSLTALSGRKICAGR